MVGFLECGYSLSWFFDKYPYYFAKKVSKTTLETLTFIVFVEH